LLVISASLTCSFTFALWYLSVQKLRHIYAAVFFLQQLALNMLLSVQSGLVPDLVPESQMDLAGGASAANVLIGAVAACGYVHLARTADYHLTYGVIVSFTLTFSAFVCAIAREKSSLHSSGGTSSQRSESSHHGSWVDLYTFDVRKHRSFAVLLLTKTLYCASVVVKGFLLFFVQDLFESLATSRYEDMVGEMAATAEIAAALSAFGLMLYLGKTPAEKSAGKTAPDLPGSNSSASRSFFYLRSGASWMSLLWLVPVILGGLANRAKSSVAAEELVATWLPPMLVGLAIWGLGQGVYLAGDQALAFALVPDRSEASRFLGFSSLCASVGSVVGGGTAAGLLAFFGAGKATGYAFPGYAAIFIFASLLSAGIAVLASASTSLSFSACT